MCTLGSKLHGHRRGGRVLQRLAIDATYCHSPQYRSAVWHCLPACIVTCRQRVVKTVAALSRRQARGGCSSPPKPSKDELPLLQAIARASATRRPSSHRSTQACSVPALLIYHHLVSSRGMCSHRQPQAATASSASGTAPGRVLYRLQAAGAVVQSARRRAQGGVCGTSRSPRVEPSENLSPSFELKA